MPNVDGLAATRAIRALDGRRNAVPIVAVSAYALPADRAAAERAGANGFVSKPVRRSALGEALAALSVRPEVPRPGGAKQSGLAAGAPREAGGTTARASKVLRDMTSAAQTQRDRGQRGDPRRRA